MGCLPPEYRQHQTKHLKRHVQSINELSHVVLRQLGDVRRDPPVVIALVALQIPKLGHRLSSWLGTASFDVPDDVSHEFNLRSGDRKKINAHKLIFDHYQQLNLVQPVEAEIVSQVRLIRNFCNFNTCGISNELTYFVGIRTALWRHSCVHSFPLRNSRAKAYNRFVGGSET